jgi:hypothetical protein
MQDKPTSRNKARFIVLAVFAVGFAAGAFAMNLYERLKPQNQQRENRPGAVAIVERLDRELNLTDQQQDRIKSIFEDTFSKYKEQREKLQPLYKQIEPHFTEIRQKSRDRVRAELTEEQLPKFEEILKEEDRKREERRK